MSVTRPLEAELPESEGVRVVLKSEEKILIVCGVKYGSLGMYLLAEEC